MRLVALVALCLVAAVACDEPADPSDAATDAGVDGDAATTGPMPPMIPWHAEGRAPVTMTPCPTGWRIAPGELVDTCAPYPEGGAQTCPVGEAHFPGEPGCRPVGAACPSGDFADALPSDGSVTYVLAGAASGGDGSLARPFGSLADVSFSSLSAGDTLALGKGSYEGTLALRSGVRVVGACAAETILTGSPSPVYSFVTVTTRGEAAVLQNLRIARPPQVAVDINGGSAARLEGVIVEGALELGVMVTESGSDLELIDVVVRGTRAADGQGYGALANDRARLHGARVIVEDTTGTNVYSGAGAQITLTDSVARGARPLPNASAGVIVTEADFEATAFLIEGNAGRGVQTNGASMVRLTDAIVRDSALTPGDAGRGLEVQRGAQLEATRLLVEGNHSAAIFLDDSGAAELTEIVARDTAVDAGGQFGWGFGVQNGSSLTVTGALVTGNVGAGMKVGIAGASAVVTDVMVHDMRPQPDGLLGTGIVIAHDADFDATRLVISRCYEVGVLAAIGTTVALRDVHISDIVPSQLDMALGHGIHVGPSTTATIERARIESVYEVGLASTAGTIVASDTSISGVLQSQCDSAECVMGLGYGAMSYGGAIDLTGFEIRDAETCGVLVAEGPEGPPSVELHSGTVAGSAIGACVQVPGYDLARLSDDVLYVDNGTNLDSTELPVPALPNTEI